MIRPLLLGHRGARGEKTIPENTFAAFDLALVQGCDGFEFDVRLTADGHAVICHDASAGGLEIAESTIRQLSLPLLVDVLARYQRTAFLNIELKVPGLEKITADLLRKVAPVRGFVVSSFLPEVLSTMHGLDAGLPLGLICETQAELSRWPELPVECVMVQHKLARKDLVSEVKAAGKKIFVWTVNVPADMRRFVKLGVNGIISDDPKRLALTGQKEEH
jgi:glycerophosphoryl diester phosphodiesterase